MSEPRAYHRLSRIYREGAWPEPNRQIEEAILATARERRTFARRWAPWLAVAAVLVLTSALALKAYREHREAVPPSTPDKASAAHAKEPAPVPEPKAAEARPAPSPQTVRTPQGFSSTMDVVEAERVDRLQRDLGLKRTLPGGESPPPAPKVAPPEKPASALKKESPETPRADPPQRAPVRAVETPQPASPISAQPPAATQAANALERPPQAWLDDIRKLLLEGKLEQADRELVEFKKRYPDYALPEDLR